MQFNVPPDLEILVNKRLFSGGYASVEDVFRRALEAQDAEQRWTDEERWALTSHIDEGFLQAERGEAHRRDSGPPRNSGVERYLASRAFAQRMSAYLLTPLARADIFEIWSYILPMTA